MDQSPVTGGSVPVDKGPRDVVFAGTVNGDGVLLVEVTKLATESALARMVGRNAAGPPACKKEVHVCRTFPTLNMRSFKHG